MLIDRGLMIWLVLGLLLFHLVQINHAGLITHLEVHRLQLLNFLFHILVLGIGEN